MKDIGPQFDMDDVKHMLYSKARYKTKKQNRGGDLCIHRADSLCFTAETNTLESNYTPIKK